MGIPHRPVSIELPEDVDSTLSDVHVYDVDELPDFFWFESDDDDYMTDYDDDDDDDDDDDHDVDDDDNDVHDDNHDVSDYYGYHGDHCYCDYLTRSWNGRSYNIIIFRIPCPSLSDVFKPESSLKDSLYELIRNKYKRDFEFFARIIHTTRDPYYYEKLIKELILARGKMEMDMETKPVIDLSVLKKEKREKKNKNFRFSHSFERIYFKKIEKWFTFHIKDRPNFVKKKGKSCIFSKTQFSSIYMMKAKVNFLKP